jgi:hypothetical protein
LKNDDGAYDHRESDGDKSRGDEKLLPFIRRLLPPVRGVIAVVPRIAANVVTTTFAYDP